MDLSPSLRTGASQTGFERSALSGVLFGHRRLSILDLSAAARQPFVSTTGSLVLAYNGEIYNYVELREELIQHGTTFRTTRDIHGPLAGILSTR